MKNEKTHTIRCGSKHRNWPGDLGRRIAGSSRTGWFVFGGADVGFLRGVWRRILQWELLACQCLVREQLDSVRRVGWASYSGNKARGLPRQLVRFC